MKDIKEKIIDIFKKYAIENNGTSLAEDGVPPTIMFDAVLVKGVIKELISLIQSEREDAVGGFIEWCYKKHNAVQMECGLDAEQYLLERGKDLYE